LPFYLFLIDIKPTEFKKTTLLDIVTRDVISNFTSRWEHIYHLHNNLLLQYNKKIVQFVYDNTTQAITYNDHFVTSGIQAKILYRILELFIDEGRTHIERRELFKDSSLITDPMNSCLTIRLNRIIKRLSIICPFLRLEKIGRGKYQVKTDAIVTLIQQQ
jgi:hypothetical protein